MVEVYRSFLLNRRNKFSIKGSSSENMRGSASEDLRTF